MCPYIALPTSRDLCVSIARCISVIGSYATSTVDQVIAIMEVLITEGIYLNNTLADNKGHAFVSLFLMMKNSPDWTFLNIVLDIDIY